MNLDVDRWKPFYLKDLYNVQMGNKFDKNKMTSENGSVNFVSRVSYNNGVDIRVDLIDGVEPYPAGMLTVALGGSYLGSCFVQEEPFYTGQNVAVLSEKDEAMNHSVNVFITALVRYESKIKYYAFGRELNTHIGRDFTIELPIQHNADGTPFIDVDKKYSDNGYVPDWKFMEDYVKSLNHKPLTTKNKKSDMVLDVVTWEEFKVGNLFDIHPTKTIKDVSSKDCEENGTTPLVVNQSYDNGITGRVNYEPTETGGIITFSDTWEGKTFFYQKEDFIGFSHVQGMYPKYKMNENVLIFISVILEFEANDRYSYGRKKRRDLIEKSYIKLPVKHNVDGTIFIDDEHTYSEEGYVPDWQFMEDYIKSLPYGDRL